MGLGFKTFVAGTLSASDVQGYLMQQSVVTCTAATRPGSPLAGMTIYQTDTDTHWVFNGMIWHEIVPAKQRLAFVPGGNLDTPLAGTATWMTFGSVNVPTWATQCIVSLTLHGIYPAGAIGTSTSAAVKIGTATGSLIRVLDPGVLGQRFQYSAPCLAHRRSRWLPRSRQARASTALTRLFGRPLRSTSCSEHAGDDRIPARRADDRCSGSVRRCRARRPGRPA
jgi:hypothetical protein